MVFANLSNHEKTAFFTLLDEYVLDLAGQLKPGNLVSRLSFFLFRYFASRPEIFANAAGASDEIAVAIGHVGPAAASAVHRALAANPEATSKLISAGLKHGVPKNSPYAVVVSLAYYQFTQSVVCRTAGGLYAEY
jgi:abl interactor 2